MIETELGEPADLEVLDQHVRACGKLLDDPASIFVFEIDLDRALAPIRGMEISGVEMAPLRRLDEGRAPAARIVAATFTLDLNDVGTEVGENLPGPGPGQDTGKLEYA